MAYAAHLQAATFEKEKLLHPYLHILCQHLEQPINLWRFVSAMF